jgi:hypothetical protein
MSVFGRAPALKNSSGAADPQISTVEQLHRGSEVSENVWYRSGFVTISITPKAHMSAEQEKNHLLPPSISADVRFRAQELD